MKTVLKLEEAALFAASVYAFSLLDYSWWWFFGLLLAPDISMLGYLAGNKAGAFTYNIFHHKAVAMQVGALGIYLSSQPVLLAGIILFAHSSMDRVFGYGLKYFTGFKHTHLGEL
ncbi:MAG TPA: DUF4260 domain-containing protein [Bacteroidia bacterium]|nr:DUF4260 domain-containing protein [Bacteroidia bacterium]